MQTENAMQRPTMNATRKSFPAHGMQFAWRFDVACRSADHPLCDVHSWSNFCCFFCYPAWILFVFGKVSTNTSLQHDIGTTSSSYYLIHHIIIYHTLIFAWLILSSSVVLVCCLCQVHFVGSSGVQEPLPALRHVARKESDEPSQLSTRSYSFNSIHTDSKIQYESIFFKEAIWGTSRILELYDIKLGMPRHDAHAPRDAWSRRRSRQSRQSGSTSWIKVGLVVICCAWFCLVKFRFTKKAQLRATLTPKSVYASVFNSETPRGKTLKMLFDVHRCGVVEFPLQSADREMRWDWALHAKGWAESRSLILRYSS